MFLASGRINKHSARRLLHLSIAALLFFITFGSSSASAQSGIDMSGTGGKHIIQGRIFYPSGRRIDRPAKVSIENPNVGSLFGFTDSNGSFSFRNLAAGSYAVVINAGEEFEIVRESVYIDQIQTRTIRDNSVRIVTLPIYLQLKRQTTKSSPAGVLNAALANVPQTAVELYTRAREAASAGNSKKAIEQYRAAISVYPEFALAFNELGVLYLKVGQTDKAVTALHSAVKLAPDAFNPRLNYGIALLEKKDFVAASAELEQAIAKNNGSPVAHLYMGISLVSLRKYDDAEKELLRALELGGDRMSLAHYYLGGLFWNKKEYRRAAEELETYLKLAPNAPNAEKIRATISTLRSKI